MERRFGFRDLVLTALVIVLIISVWLAMKQYDRQWQLISRIHEQLKDQAATGARIQRKLGELHDLFEQGVPAIGGSETGSGSANPVVTGPESDPFIRIRAAKQRPDYKSGDWIVDAFHANVARITPLVTGDAYGAAIQGRVLESLLTRDPETLDWQAWLASSWAVSDDGLVISFKLRRGITFSDGHPLTAQDVVFSFQLINNPQIDAPRARNYFDKLESVTATGEYEVIFTFKEPYFQAMGMAGGMDVLPQHFYSRFSPQEINRKPGLLLGSGPYRMESPAGWSPGKPLILVRNERYWGETPAFDRLVYREINNDVARLTAFRNREIDLFSAMPEQYVKMLKDQDLLAKSQHFEFERPTSGYGFIAWNQRRNGQATVFADRRVRRAMTMLTDRRRINREILMGYGIIPSGPFNRLSKQHDPQIEPYSYDEQRTTALLKEAGFEDRDGDGVLESSDGQPFRFEHTYPASGGGAGIWDRLSLFLKDSYARAGVVLVPDPLEWAVFKEKLQTRQFDAISLAWGGGLESDIRQMFHSSQISDGADNFTSYRNEQLDRLIDEARRIVVEEKRMPLWHACHQILHEDQPYTFLYSRQILNFLDQRIHNVQHIRLGLNDRDEWYVPAPLQKYAR